jgi:toxin ParE1/3/4
VKLVRLSDVARSDVRDAAAYLQQESLSFSVPRRFLVAFEEACLSLANFPDMGNRLRGLRPELEGMRCLILRRFDNYIIFYRVSESSIHIDRVLHGARDIITILESGVQED